MLQPDGRRPVKQKWSVCKTDGPLTYVAELVVKRMHKNWFPCKYEIVAFPFGLSCWFEHMDKYNTAEFEECLEYCVEIECLKLGVKFDFADRMLRLFGEYTVDALTGRVARLCS